MTPLYRLMRSRWVRTLLGAIIFAVVVWFFGPLLGVGALHPLDSELVRLLVIAAIFVLWLVENLVHALRARQRERDLVAGVSEAAPDPNVVASTEEVATLAGRLKEALSALKRARIGGGGGRYLYQLPWYVFIGPPGAGKTTALANSGLTFPLADTFGPQAVRGVGGTRNCDWWFTDQAVLIDTAGRYTTQDSNVAVDSATWLGFLKLLKKYRRRQPLNGVLVAISLSDLAALDDAGRSAHARAIRKRVRELHDELGVRVPIYVLFTKADMIAGFVEFFDSFGRDERQQVWGMTFPLDDGRDEAGAVAAFGREFDQLLERLNARMIERVHQEPDLGRRRLIYGFPQQIGSLRDVAAEFLNEIFRPSKLEARPLLRGVYFTSGTQDGTVIDRLLGAMAAQFGLPRPAATAFSGSGRSYFLGQLVRDVIFGEAGLVSSDPKVERLRRWSHIAAYAAAVLFVVGLATAWATSYFGNIRMIEDVDAAVAKYDAEYAELGRRDPKGTDLAAILPPLDTLRGVRGGYDERDADTPITLTFGLYQGAALTAAAVDAYGRALNGLLRPRLLARLEREMRLKLPPGGPNAAPDLDTLSYLYGALKVYLMLDGQGRLKPELVTAWLQDDVGADELPRAARERLGEHLRAMLDLGPPREPPAPDAELIAQVREVLNKRTLAEYVFDRLLASPEVRGIKLWAIADHAGPTGGRGVFARADGKDLNSGVDGVYTWEGYHKTFRDLIGDAAQYAPENHWVLGIDDGGGALDALNFKQQGKLAHDLLELYLAHYIRQWDVLLSALTLKPFRDADEERAELSDLSSPVSPLRELFRAVDQETQLSRASAEEQGVAQAESKVVAKLTRNLSGYLQYLLLPGMSREHIAVWTAASDVYDGDSKKQGGVRDPLKQVDDHFAALHVFVAGGKDKGAELDTVIGKIGEIYKAKLALANAASPGDASVGALVPGGGGGTAAADLKESAKSAPDPLKAMLQSVAQGSAQVTATAAAKQLADEWRSDVQPRCAEALNRYPFIKASTQDAPLGDFAHLLGPAGQIDKFFDKYLKPFTDTSQKSWRWTSPDHARLGLSDGSLAQFQNAADIRDSLFGAGGTQVAVAFTIEPEAIDPTIAKVGVEIGGVEKDYIGNAPTEPVRMEWPGKNGNIARVTLTPVAGGNATVIEGRGPWALLRLLDKGRVNGQADNVKVTFATESGSGVTFNLLADSTRNPFTLKSLRDFRCPSL